MDRCGHWRALSIQTQLGGGGGLCRDGSLMGLHYLGSVHTSVTVYVFIGIIMDMGMPGFR